MKKTFSILLALVLVLALSAPAFADVPATGGTSQDVTATYVPAVEGGMTGTVYAVTITWTPNTMSDLTYNGGSEATYVWNAGTLQYEVSAGNNIAEGWTGSTGYQVTITNKSNADVTAAVAATANYSLTAERTGDEDKTLERADKAIYEKGEEQHYWTDTATQGTATTMTVTYTYSDKGGATAPEAPSGNSVTVGTITVSLS